MVYVSRDLQSRLTRGRPNKGCVIYNGALERHDRVVARPGAYRADILNIVVLGRLDKVKNVGAAIRAVSQPVLRKSCLLHIVGDGPEKANLESLCRSLGLTATVIFHGFQHDPVPFLAHADILLIPSLHEGIPYVVLEAMQSGVAIVAAKVGGIPEILEHMRTALLIEPTDVNSLCDALAMLAGDAQLRMRISSGAREQFGLHWSAQKMILSYRQLYESVIASSHH
jgi:glycosyltransferase involved in cell wall biosynthesis